ncbi:MAG: hypothetical protein DRJ03_25740 [Chloroflexi bacterium]|nr:MAG: hypothetical protein DRJ03_25740 [Chloroflexota bacterium]
MKVLDLSYHPSGVRSGGWVDLSRKDNHGTPYGGARPYMIAPGVMGFEFDGSSGYVNVASSPTLSSAQDLTIFGCLYMRRGRAETGIAHVWISKSGNIWGTDREWYFWQSAANEILFSVVNESDTECFSYVVPMNLNEWTYITATFDGQCSRVYKNRDLIGVKDCGAGFGNRRLGGNDIHVGGRFNNSNSYNWDGFIAQVVIEDRAWSEAEIRENMYRSPIYRMLRGLPHSWIYTKVPWKWQGGIYVL